MKSELGLLNLNVHYTSNESLKYKAQKNFNIYIPVLLKYFSFFTVNMTVLHLIQAHVIRKFL